MPIDPNCPIGRERGDHPMGTKGCTCVTGARRFPIQQGGTVPWWAAERAYKGYAAAGHGDQSLEKMAQRGGFGVEEFGVLFQGLEYNDARFEDRSFPAIIATAIELGAQWDVTASHWLQPERKRKGA